MGSLPALSDHPAKSTAPTNVADADEVGDREATLANIHHRHQDGHQKRE